LIIAAVAAHATPETSLRLVRSILFGRDAYQRWADVATELLGGAS
jgi:hypothetical protein